MAAVPTILRTKPMAVRQRIRSGCSITTLIRDGAVPMLITEPLQFISLARAGVR